ncbi:hypothetical protein FA95DRAFT_1563456, partial [Auriscalpium vulgare]
EPMGQRHQAFVIARVRPHGAASSELKYRCIAAYHHQWCYGTLPLRAVLRFVDLIKQDDNAMLVRAEIDEMHGKYGRWEDEPKMPEVPASVVAFLLATSLSIALEAEEVYVSGVSFENNLLDADMGTGDGDNEEGITIIDVTDPTAPRYCFNTIYGPPLSALQYVRGYYAVSDDALAGKVKLERAPQDTIELITAMKAIPMITSEMLHEAWPSDYEHTVTTDAAKAEREEPPVELPSMRAMTLRVAIAHTLDSEEGDTSGLEDWMWQPEMLTFARAALRERNPFPNTGVPLLKAIVARGLEADPSSIDLSGFVLSSAQIAQIVTGGASLRTVTLSNNAIVTVEAVRHVLTAAPNLERLVLLGCPAITDAALVALVEAEPALFYRIGALLHPAFLTAGDVNYANAFSLVLFDRQSIQTFSRPYFTPEGVVDALTVLLGALVRTHNLSMFTLMQSALVSHVAMSAAPLRTGQTWATRSTALIPLFSHRAMHGEGWCFLFRMDQFGRKPNSYGFVRFFAEGAEETAAEEQGDGECAKKIASEEGASPAVGEVLDMRAFLARMVAEGRPAAPEDKVVALEGHLAALAVNKCQLGLMTKEDLVEFRQQRFSSF